MRKSEFATLLLTAALLLMAWSGSWFVLTGTGSYTEGLDREPTIVVEYTIDAFERSLLELREQGSLQ